MIGDNRRQLRPALSSRPTAASQCSPEYGQHPGMSIFRLSAKSFPFARRMTLAGLADCAERKKGVMSDRRTSLTIILETAG